jgi:uncharacterized phage protein gp47/JayE
VVEPYLTDNTQPIAYIEVYIHNGSTGASSELEARAQQVLTGYYVGNVAVPGWKAAGVNMTLQVATNVPVDVTGVVTVDPSYTASDVVSSATQAINTYLSNLNIGESALVADLYKGVMAVAGVINFQPSVPGSDTAATNVQKLTPGTLTLTAA